MRVTKASQRCIDLIVSHEKLRTVAYDDATGKPAKAGVKLLGKLTNGYGHTGADVFVGQVIDEAKAMEWLMADIASAERAVLRYCKVDLNQNEFDALVDFVFNAGSGRFAGSTLLKKLNAGDREGAANEFGKWVYGTVGGVSKKLDDLIKRRGEERAMFVAPLST